eukprot:PhF_6_TR1437/c0_g1_i1/m.2541
MFSRGPSSPKLPLARRYHTTTSLLQRSHFRFISRMPRTVKTSTARNCCLRCHVPVRVNQHAMNTPTNLAVRTLRTPQAVIGIPFSRIAASHARRSTLPSTTKQRAQRTRCVSTSRSPPLTNAKSIAHIVNTRT